MASREDGNEKELVSSKNSKNRLESTIGNRQNEETVQVRGERMRKKEKWLKLI